MLKKVLIAALMLPAAAQAETARVDLAPVFSSGSVELGGAEGSVQAKTRTLGLGVDVTPAQARWLTLSARVQQMHLDAGPEEATVDTQAVAATARQSLMMGWSAWITPGLAIGYTRAEGSEGSAQGFAVAPQLELSTMVGDPWGRFGTLAVGYRQAPWRLAGEGDKLAAPREVYGQLKGDGWYAGASYLVPVTDQSADASISHGWSVQGGYQLGRTQLRAQYIEGLEFKDSSGLAVTGAVQSYLPFDLTTPQDAYRSGLFLQASHPLGPVQARLSVGYDRNSSRTRTSSQPGLLAAGDGAATLREKNYSIGLGLSRDF